MIKDEDFQIGNCYKTKSKLPISFRYGIRKDSNVIYLGFKPFMKIGKMIKVLYIGKIYHFPTFENLSSWFEELQ